MATGLQFKLPLELATQEGRSCPSLEEEVVPLFTGIWALYPPEASYALSVLRALLLLGHQAGGGLNSLV